MEADPDAPLLHRSTLHGSVFGAGVRDRLREVSVRFTGVVFQICKSDDLALFVDGARRLQDQSGVFRNQSIHVGCDSIAPQDGSRVETRVERNSKHHAVVTDGGGEAVRVTRQGSKIGDVPLLPEKGMKALVAGGVGFSHNLPAIVETLG